MLADEADDVDEPTLVVDVGVVVDDVFCDKWSATTNGLGFMSRRVSEEEFEDDVLLLLPLLLLFDVEEEDGDEEAAAAAAAT